MNEKLKELGIEACCQYQPLFDNIGMGQYTKSQYNKAIEDMMHKFAELIIQEMLQTCENHPEWTGRMIGEQIKYHFWS